MIERHKNRYVLVEASDLLESGDKSVAQEITNSLAVEMGAVGYARANPKIVCQAGDRFFVVRINRGYEGDLILAFAFIKNLGGKKVGFFTIKTSGTIRKIISPFKKK